MHVVIATTTPGDDHVVATGTPVQKAKRRCRRKHVIVYNVCHQLVQTKAYRKGGEIATQSRIWGWMQRFLGQPVACPKPSFYSSHDSARILAAFDVVPQSQHASTSHPHTQSAGAPAGHRGHRGPHGAVATGADGRGQSQAHGCGAANAPPGIRVPGRKDAAAPAHHSAVPSTHHDLRHSVAMKHGVAPTAAAADAAHVAAAMAATVSTLNPDRDQSCSTPVRSGSTPCGVLASEPLYTCLLYTSPSPRD